MKLVPRVVPWDVVVPRSSSVVELIPPVVLSDVVVPRTSSVVELIFGVLVLCHQWLMAMGIVGGNGEQTKLEFSRAMDTTTHPSIWPVNEDPLVLEVLGKGIQSIIIGESAPEKVAAEVQKAKTRQMEKAKKQG